MAITINGTGSITGLTAGGLPDGSVTTDDLAANAVTAAKLAAGTGGKILNVWQGVFTGSQSFAPGSNVPGARADITDLSVTLTPASASSKFLITCSINMGGGANSPAYYLMRDSTDILVSTITGGSAVSATWGAHQSGTAGYEYSTDIQAISYVDSPATTDEITYKVQGQNAFGGGNNVYVNRCQKDGNGSNQSYYVVRGCSTITVMEISS